MKDRLALGTVQFGLNYGVANKSGQVDAREVGKIIAAAASGGMRTMDTAIAYGSSESVVGACSLASWKIVTKLPALPEDCTDVSAWVMEQLRASLARLNVEAVYGLLLHRPDQLLGPNGKALLEALQLAQARGMALKIGISVYAPIELESLFALHPFELVQAPLNILDRRLVESGWALRLKDRGVELHTRSAFLQGLLLMPADLRPIKFARWAPIWEEWARWLASTRLSPLQACLRYVLSVPEVDRLVVGVDSIKQLEDILSATDGVLPSLPRWPVLPEVELINPAHWNRL